ncbi:MAG: HD domain-containing protein [Planctomycetes bacterium]|nr:HD domain-containing protein [Planctomycetota bacterium]
MSRKKATFVALKGKLESKPFLLEAGKRIVLGRGEGADIQVLDSGLSRLHCFIERQDESFVLQDMGSRNGTWVNGNRIERAHLLPGDRVKIGGIEFEFNLEDDRRRTQANLVASIPERVGGEIKEKLKMETADLMNLSPKFQNIENYRKVQQDLATIYKIGNLIHSEHDLKNLYKCIMDAIFDVVEAERGFLILADEKTQRLAPVVGRHRRGDVPESEMAFSHTIVDESFKSGYSFLSADAMADDRFKEGESIIFKNIRSVMCVPVQTQQRILGVIYVDTVTDAEAFAKHELELLTAIGKQAGIAIERAQLMERLEKLFLGSIRTLVATIEAKDKYTFGHSERVTAYALQIATELGIPEDQMVTCQLAGLLHDVGKIGVTDTLLSKNGPLTDDEYSDVKRHPSVGAKIISNIEETADIAQAIRHHHERWDGSGYPDGLTGEDIPLASRILSVADAFDAMTSRRPYRDMFTRDEVMEELERKAGSQFDQKVVEAFLRLCRQGKLKTPASYAEETSSRVAAENNGVED